MNVLLMTQLSFILAGLILLTEIKVYAHNYDTKDVKIINFVCLYTCIVIMLKGMVAL